MDTNTIIDKIASDLGIFRFSEETLQQYKCRVLYSAMSSWIKAIALDKPVGSIEEGFSGVSRRHVYERSRVVLDTMVKMHPETENWFNSSETDNHSVNIIRTRLINHGDLLNEGFDTNIALAAVRSEPISPKISVVYGRILEDGLQYSGISAIRYEETNLIEENPENVCEWMRSFLKEAWWSRDLPDMSKMQYFNPYSLSKNNYSAWQDSIAEKADGVILMRSTVNKHGYEYYLLKPKEKLVHKLDPFLQSQRYHIRMTYALRAEVNNNAAAVVIRYGDHVNLRLNTHLPLKERELLESYAWPVRHINDQLYWVMCAHVWDYIRPRIEALNIRILEETHG